jgi:hypothetical protein
MLFLDHVHHVEAVAEDGYGERTKHWFLMFTQGHAGESLSNISCHREELIFAQALVDKVTKDLESSMALGIGAVGDGIENGRQKVGPLFGKVVNGDFSNGITSRVSAPTSLIAHIASPCHAETKSKLT